MKKGFSVEAALRHRYRAPEFAIRRKDLESLADKAEAILNQIRSTLSIQT